MPWDAVVAYNTRWQAKILDIVIEGDNKSGEGCVHEHRKDYCSMNSTLDESKGERPSITSVNVISQHL